MEKRTIVIQLDSDPHPSVFDRVVAVDSGADEIFSYGGVQPKDVVNIVHGAIFTRGPKDLHRTAIFIGGTDVAAGERLVAEARKHMIPQYGLQVSILLDANGCNTTAAAAVHLASKHLPLNGAAALVLGGTGPVGQRVARLLAIAGSSVRVASRKLDRAEAVCGDIAAKVANAKLEAAATSTADELSAALAGRQLVIAAGAAGVTMLPAHVWKQSNALKLAIDLNAVPPAGIEGVAVTDSAAEHDGVICYGAVGVGNTKMKIHRRAIAKLFERNDQVMDAEEVFALAKDL